MDASLKSLIPALAGALEMKPAALYERQRALVRAGLIKSEPGRGPGSGVRATPQALAMLLISIVATDSLSEVEAETRAIANLKSVGGPCPVTGKKTFGAALTYVLNAQDLHGAKWIAVERRGTAIAASIVFNAATENESLTHSEFGVSHQDFYKYFTNIQRGTTLLLRRVLKSAAILAEESEK